MKKMLYVIAMVVVYAAVAFLISYVVYLGGRYPVGIDTYEYLYHGRLLLDQIMDGNYFPLYDQNWYNGSLFLRVYEPIPMYTFAGMFYLTNMDASSVYLIYLAVIFFLGALVWLYIGAKKNRIVLGSILGFLWFFMPNNLHAIFLEGNLSRGFCMILLPLLFFEIYECLFDSIKALRLFAIIVSTAVIGLCDCHYIIMCGIAMLVLFIGYQIHFHEWKRLLYCSGAFLIGIGITSAWLFPYIMTDVRDISNPEIMSYYFQSFVSSINPVYRMGGNDQHYYFGLAALIVAFFGMIAAGKKSRLGYRVVILIFLATTSTSYVALSALTDNQHFYMLEFISIGLCLILLELLYWKTLKPFFLCTCILFLVLDCIPSILVNKGDGMYSSYEQIENLERATLLDEAKDITNQRMIFVDNGLFESAGQYCAVVDKEREYIPQVLGLNWQYSSTDDWITDISESIERRAYVSLFDHLLNLGCDTVLLYTDSGEYLSKDIPEILDAANLYEYELYDSKGKYYLFHRDTPQTFGLLSSFDSICIGSYGKLMAYQFTDMYVAEEINLNKYSFDDLKDYKLIYLSGFTYDSKTQAEELVKALADSGVRVVIDASNLMVDEYNGQKSFLGVTCQNISFSNGYPILYVNEKEVICSLFPKENSDWNSVYLNGLSTVTGYLYDNNIEVAFMGSVESENITFVGINLPYHYFITKDPASGSIMEELIAKYIHVTPERTVVPLKIEYDKDSITIESEYDLVNTTLANLDIFEEESFFVNQHLIHANKGITKIKITKRFYGTGIALSVVFSILGIALLIFIKKKERK